MLSVKPIQDLRLYRNNKVIIVPKLLLLLLKHHQKRILYNFIKLIERYVVLIYKDVPLYLLQCLVFLLNLFVFGFYFEVSV